MESEKSTKKAEGLGRFPSILLGFVVAVCILATPWIFLRAAHRTPGAKSEALVADRLAEQEYVHGGRIYARSCTACHGMRGEGKPGRYPSLISSPWLLGDKETPIRLVLLGTNGPMDAEREPYSGVMPNLGIILSDLDIARVLNYTRSTWGNEAPEITEDDVAKVRASLGKRQEPWRGGAELIEAKKTPVLE